jgi:hypothetical protein
MAGGDFRPSRLRHARKGKRGRRLAWSKCGLFFIMLRPSIACRRPGQARKSAAVRRAAGRKAGEERSP